MSPSHYRRIKQVAYFLSGLTAVAFLVLHALTQNINLFYTPTQVKMHEAPLEKRIRIGGMVEHGTLKKNNDLTVNFKVTDFQNTISVTYKGLLPDLFKENQGVVALGKLSSNNLFFAEEILAKHDENYMPPEAAQALQQAKRLNAK